MNSFGFVAWRIWPDRNSLVHDKAVFNAQVSYTATVHRYNEYARVTISQGRGVKEKQKQWRPPWSGFLKLNSDGDFVPNKRVGGAGVIIRNDIGKIMVARIVPLQGITTPRHAEILVISCGIQLALELDFSKLELELDAQEIVQAILDGKENIAINWHPLDVIKTLLRQFFMATCSYAPGECNQIVHEFASFAAKHQVFCTWEENFPPWLASLAQVNLHV